MSGMLMLVFERFGFLLSTMIVQILTNDVTPPKPPFGQDCLMLKKFVKVVIGEKYYDL